MGQGLLIIKNRAAISRKVISDPAKTLEQIDQIEDTAAQTIKEVRQIAYALRPYQLDAIGLTQALKDLVAKINETGPTSIKATIAYIDDLYENDAAINLYRIVQEALNNVVKHSGAKEVAVTVTREESQVLLLVEDNGHGFVVDSARANETRRGFGLTGLAERASMLNGRLTIDSTPGRGTTVRLSLKIQDTNHGR